MELYDDETVTETMDLQGRVRYCNLLLDIIETDYGENKNYLKMRLNGIPQKRIKIRIDVIMKEKKTYRLLAVVFGVCIFYFGAVVAFAYENVQNIDMSQQEGKEYEECGEGEWDEFVFETKVEKILYDDSFIDEEGNVYPITQESNYKNCQHNYISGEYRQYKKSGKGCIVNYYNAEYCSYCGGTIIGDFIHTDKWEICPH